MEIIFKSFKRNYTFLEQVSINVHTGVVAMHQKFTFNRTARTCNSWTTPLLY